jgi:hypothetical protein
MISKIPNQARAGQIIAILIVAFFSCAKNNSEALNAGGETTTDTTLLIGNIPTVAIADSIIQKTKTLSEILENIPEDSLIKILDGHIFHGAIETVVGKQFSDETLLNAKGACSSGVLLRFEYINVAHEQYVQIFWITQDMTELKISETNAFEVTDYDDDKWVSVDTDAYHLSEKCKILMVEEKHSWGQTGSQETITHYFYVIKDSSTVTAIFSFTEKLESYVDTYGEGPNESTVGSKLVRLETRTLDVLPTSWLRRF